MAGERGQAERPGSAMPAPKRAGWRRGGGRGLLSWSRALLRAGRPAGPVSGPCADARRLGRATAGHRAGGASHRGDRVAGWRAAGRRAVGFGATNGQALARLGAAERFSGACSRTIIRATSRGIRRRVASEPITMTANAIGTAQAAGCASSAPAQPGCGPPTTVTSDGGDRQAAADDQTGERTDVGEPAPPDAEHEQRAERRRRDGEGQPDHRGQRRAAGCGRLSTYGTRIAAAQPTGTTDRARASRRSRAARPATARRPPRRSARTTSTGRPRTRRRSPARRAACPGSPPSIRSGSSSTVASVSPVSSRSGA